MGIFSGVATFAINTYFITKNKKILAWIDKNLKGLKYRYGIELKRREQNSINIIFENESDQIEFAEQLDLKISNHTKAST